jgi:uracil-DNA glycosylase
MIFDIHPSWNDVFQKEIEKPYFATLFKFVDEAYSKSIVYPPREQIFEAFKRTSFDKVKAVIIGQDPYHEPGQAQGLAFYVPPNITPPPSLKNIAKELGKMPDLLSWADNGVLLLNATLTVNAHSAGSHKGMGWEIFTDSIIKELAEKRENLVFILWGSYAQRKGQIADPKQNLILKSVHPSPLSVYRGFFGCRHFSQANAYLQSIGKEPIAW